MNDSRTTSTRLPWIIAAVGGVGLAGIVAFLVAVLEPPDFRSSFDSNFLATIAGFLVGVPVAIWLALRQNKDQTDAADRKANKEARVNRDGVLRAIRQELVENKSTLENDRRPGGTRNNVAVPFLMDEVWSAMSDGGQLQWIKDAELLRRLARAYVFVRTNIFLEKQAFEIRHYPGQRAVLDPAPEQGRPLPSLPEPLIMGSLNHQDLVCIAAIDEVLELVDKALAEAESPAGQLHY